MQKMEKSTEKQRTKKNLQTQKQQIFDDSLFMTSSSSTAKNLPKNVFKTVHLGHEPAFPI
jgi:hypothetical protein